MDGWRPVKIDKVTKRNGFTILVPQECVRLRLFENVSTFRLISLRLVVGRTDVLIAEHHLILSSIKRVQLLFLNAVRRWDKTPDTLDLSRRMWEDTMASKAPTTL